MKLYYIQTPEGIRRVKISWESLTDLVREFPLHFKILNKEYVLKRQPYGVIVISYDELIEMAIHVFTKDL